MALILTLLVLSVATDAVNGSNSLEMFGTYSTGQMPFPELSVTVMLDDITVAYFDSNTKIYIPRGNTTDESHVINPKDVIIMYKTALYSFQRRSNQDKRGNDSEGLLVYQKLLHIELSGNSDTGLMITRDAARGVSTDEAYLLGDNFTHHGTLNIPTQDLKDYLELSEDRHKNIYYPICISALKNYLNTRASQLNRKIKPTVRMIQKPHSGPGGSRVSCLATGFYPRHINLTLFRDCQPVLDHEITGGDLLPNNDGTYQMRKSLEISAEEEKEKHNYTCSVIHISLDDKLDVCYKEKVQDHTVIAVIAAVLVCFTACIVISVYKRRQAVSSNSAYRSASATEENETSGNTEL